ncbi:hypothetical protein GCM10010990_36170 [Croceicoccus mobilis]|uniref:Uncharacterized protein n=1 Tax=Croceicoccus mobilis TaxID=1703339 RepID=A0A916Z9I4_9SPHN|nr:hypothetical protein GCM10010990_36170 [Croceicoccus mobilis]
MNADGNLSVDCFAPDAIEWTMGSSKRFKFRRNQRGRLRRRNAHKPAIAKIDLERGTRIVIGRLLVFGEHSLAKFFSGTGKDPGADCSCNLRRHV